MKFSFHFRNKNQRLSVDDVLYALREVFTHSSHIKFIGSRETFNMLKALISLELEPNRYVIQYRNSSVNNPIILVEHYESI